MALIGVILPKFKHKNSFISSPMGDLVFGLDWQGIFSSNSSCDLLADCTCVECGLGLGLDWSCFDMLADIFGYVSENDDSETESGM